MAQIKVTRGTFICAQIEIYEYTNRILVSTWNITTLTRPSFHYFCCRSICGHLDHCQDRRRRPPLSLLPPSPSPPSPPSPPLPRHDSHFRCYCCCFLVDCCLPPLLPLFPSAAAVLSCPRRCHRCCLVAANTTASPVPSAVIEAAAAAARAAVSAAATIAVSADR